MKELQTTQRLEQEIKKSRFIAIAAKTDDPKTVLTVIEALRTPDATHNCWAYRIGDVYRFSDDGEPGGTAGRPILAAIEKQQFDRCLVMVTRYFGGIKLGAGGLARAYGGVASECLRTAPFSEIRPLVTLSFIAPFDSIGEVYNLLKTQHAEKKEEQFVPQGVRLTVTVEASERTAFDAALASVTRGRVSMLP